MKEICTKKEFIHRDIYCKCGKPKQYDTQIQSYYNKLGLDQFCSITTFTEKLFNIQSKLMYWILRTDITTKELGGLISEYEEQMEKEITLHMNKHLNEVKKCIGLKT